MLAAEVTPVKKWEHRTVLNGLLHSLEGKCLTRVGIAQRHKSKPAVPITPGVKHFVYNVACHSSLRL